MFTMSIKTRNSAFEDKEYEVSRLLNEVAKKIKNGDTDGSIHDADGNNVGKFKLK